MKYIRVWLKSGKRVRLSEVGSEDKVIGIILRSGHIVSLSLISPDHKIFSSNFQGLRGTKEIEKAEKDMCGKENTSKLPLSIELKDNEYIPAIGELKEAIKELGRIRYVREFLHLESIPQDCWFWTSTVRNNETIWLVHSIGIADWYRWDNYCGYCDYVLAFLKM